MFDSYTPSQIAIILIVYLFAATAKGVTGLGFSTTCLPFLVVTVGLKAALPLLIIPSISSNIIVMIGAGEFRATLSRFWPMFAATVPGLLLGLWLLDSVPGEIAAGILGIVLIGYCAFAFANPDLRLASRLERPVGGISGLLTGMVNGLTGSQVMPLMPYLLSLHLERNLFIQACNCSFTMSSLIMAVGLAGLGLMTIDAAILSSLGVAFAFAGIRIGERLRNLLAPEQFRWAVLLMLVLLGVSLAVRAI